MGMAFECDWCKTLHSGAGKSGHSFTLEHNGLSIQLNVGVSHAKTGNYSSLCTSCRALAVELVAEETVLNIRKPSNESA